MIRVLAITLCFLSPVVAQPVYSPEQFGAIGNGIANDAPAFNAANIQINAAGGGILQLTCGHNYLWDKPYSTNGLSLVNWLTKVNISGCGNASVIKLADNVNTSSIQFAHMLGSYLPTTINGTWLRDVVFDYNGLKNSCSGTCWALNGVVVVEGGNKVSISHNQFFNNSGSNTILAGRNLTPQTLTNFTAEDNYFSNDGDRINPAAIDFSALWVTAYGYSLTNNHFDLGPVINGAAIEMHGFNGVATTNTIQDYFNGVNIANESTSPTGPSPSSATTFSNNVLRNVTDGITVWSKPGASQINVSVVGNNVIVNAANYHYCIDADGNVSSGNNVNLLIALNNCQSSTSTTSSTAAAIRIGPWFSANIIGNQIYQTPGPAILLTSNVQPSSTINVQGNMIYLPGLGPTKIGIQSLAPSAAGLNFIGNLVNGSGLAYGIFNATNSTGGFVGNTNIGAATKIGGGSNLGIGANF